MSFNTLATQTCAVIAFLCFSSVSTVAAEEYYLRGRDEAEVQKKAYQGRWKYPTSPIKCGKFYCEQRWSR
jgi:hypothetical protein